MVLRLDPRYPVAWRTPTSMQLGFTGHPLVIEDVSPAAERMIAALIAGVSRTGLRMIGRTAGASELEVDDLLQRLGPALTPEQPPRPWAVTVVGSGTTADTIAGLLGVAGMAVTAARSAAIATRVPADLAVVVGNFAIRSDLSRLWLQRDVPHLAVVLGDDAADVGPLVVPGDSACLLCVAHHATDADAAWPALATQLHDRPSPADTRLVAADVAVAVVRIARAHLDERGWPSGEITRVDALTGARTVRTVAPHPLCGCLAMPTASGVAAGR